MQPSEVPAKGDFFGNVSNRLVCGGRRRLVVHREHDAGDDLNYKQISWRSAQAEPPFFHVVRDRFVGKLAQLLARNRNSFFPPIRQA